MIDSNVHVVRVLFYSCAQTLRVQNMQSIPAELLLDFAEQSVAIDPHSLFKLKRLNTRLFKLLKNNPYLWSIASNGIINKEYLSFLQISKDEMLLFAVSQENIPLLKSLIYAGYDIHKVFDLETRNTLISEPITTPDSDELFGGHTLLHDACRFGSLKVVQVLVEHGANINQTTDNGVTPLHLAAKYGSFDVCEYLLEIGAVIDCKTTNLGQTPLHYLCHNRNNTTSDICLLFHMKKANIHCRDNYGSTPMILSVMQGNLKLFKTLLKLDRSQIDCTDNQGRAALHHAVLNNQPEICSELVHHGANLELKDNYGMSAKDESVPDNFVDEAIIRMLNKTRGLLA